MKYIIVSLLIIIFGLLESCNTKKVKFKKNEKLIDFKSSIVMDVDKIVELDEQTSRVLYSDSFNTNTDTIKYENGLIYISYLSIVNGCGHYAGDIEIKSDSIILKHIDTVGFSCAEPRCDRLVYIIKNIENKKYLIGK